MPNLFYKLHLVKNTFCFCFCLIITNHKGMVQAQNLFMKFTLPASNATSLSWLLSKDFTMLYGCLWVP